MSARSLTKADEKTFDDFITECNEYASLVEENEKLQKKAKKSSQKIDRSLIKKPILTAAEENFFNNIRENFFKGAEKIVEQITEKFSLTQHMRERTHQHIKGLYIHATDFFKTLPNSFNLSRILKTATIWTLNALIAFHAWQLAKKIASDNGLGFVFDDVIEPLMGKLRKLVEDSIGSFTKKISSLIENAGDWLGKTITFTTNTISAMMEAISETIAVISGRESKFLANALTSIFDTIVGFFTPGKLLGMYFTILKLGGLNLLFSMLGELGIIELKENIDTSVSNGNLDSYRQILRNQQLSITNANQEQVRTQRDETIGKLETDAIITLVRNTTISGAVNEDEMKDVISDVRFNHKKLDEAINLDVFENGTYDNSSMALVQAAVEIARNETKTLSKEKYIEYIRSSRPHILVKNEWGKPLEGNPTDEQLQKAYEAYKRYHEAQQILSDATTDGALGIKTVPTILHNNMQTNAYEESEIMFFSAYNSGNQGYKNFKSFVDGDYDEIKEIQEMVVKFVSNGFWEKMSELAERVKKQYLQREEETHEIQTTTEDSRLLQNITADRKEYNRIRPVAAEGTGNLSMISRILYEQQRYTEERLTMQQNLYRQLSEKYKRLVEEGRYETRTPTATLYVPAQK